MEDKINAPVGDGEESKDVIDVVSEVLVKKTKKNSFLVNVGMKSLPDANSAGSQRELEAELVEEKQTSSDLRELVKTQQQQMDELMKKFQGSETARARQDEELKKKQAETDVLIKGLMSMIPSLPRR
jgi:predicted nuclease with TOPRIM domain